MSKKRVVFCSWCHARIGIFLAAVFFLYPRLPLSAQPSLILDSLLSASRQEEIWGNYTRSFQLAEMAYTIADSSRANEALISALLHRGTIYYLRSNYLNAFADFSNALRRSDSLTYTQGIILSRHKIGLIYWRQTRYDDAFKEFNTVVTMASDIGDSASLGNALHGIGSLYNRMGTNDYAESFLRQGLYYRQLLNDSVGISNSYNSIGLVLNHLPGKKDSAIYYFNESIRLKEKIHYQKGLAQSLYNLANIYEKQGELRRAESLHEAALAIDESLGDLRGIANSYLSISSLRIKQKRYEEALRLANQAFSLADSLGTYSEAADALLALVDVYEAMGNNAKALETHKYHSTYSHRAFSQSLANRTAELRLEYELDSRDKEIRLLKNEQHLKTAEIQFQTLTRNLLLISFVFVLSFSVLLIVRYRDKQRSEGLLQVSNQLLVTQREELRKANTAKSELLGIVAHDLKSPLQTITGFATLMEEDLDQNSPQRPLLNEIVRGSERMLTLIQKLLVEAEIETGQIKITLLPIDFSALVSTVITELASQAKAKDQTVISSLSLAVTVNGDTLRLHQVVENLLSNAIKFSPYSTEIRITLLTQSADEIKSHHPQLPRLESGSRWAVLSIADKGQGLTAKDFEILFGKFKRLSARPTGGESSTGLGLSIAKEMVTAHSGVLFAESAGKGYGATFYVLLPLTL